MDTTMLYILYGMQNTEIRHCGTVKFQAKEARKIKFISPYF